MQACGGSATTIRGSIQQPPPPSLWTKNGSPNFTFFPLKNNDVNLCNKVASKSSSPPFSLRSSVTLSHTPYVPAPEIGNTKLLMMAKEKSKSKQVATTPKERPTKEEQHKKPPPSTLKKPVDEIDAIFSSTKKRKKPQRKKVEREEGNKNYNNSKVVFKKVKNIRGSKDDLFGEAPSRSRKKTSDGLAIYSEEELGINKPDAGSTPLCPFDCDCCF